MNQPQADHASHLRLVEQIKAKNSALQEDSATPEPKSAGLAQKITQEPSIALDIKFPKPEHQLDGNQSKQN